MGVSDPVYKAYFGTTPTSEVSSVLKAVSNENSVSRTYVPLHILLQRGWIVNSSFRYSLSCADTLNACSSGVIAYTVIATTNVSLLFASFFLVVCLISFLTI